MQSPNMSGAVSGMPDTVIKPKTRTKTKGERPRLHKVILVNDDFTPREFVGMVLKAEFRMSEDQAMRVMMTAHRHGACVVAVYTRTSRKPKQYYGSSSASSGGTGQRPSQKKKRMLDG